MQPSPRVSSSFCAGKINSLRGMPAKLVKAKRQRERRTIPSSPEVEELSSGSGDDPGDPGDCLPILESGRPYSYPPLGPLLSSPHWRPPFSGDTDRPSLASAGNEPRLPSLASGQPNLFPKSPLDTAERFLGRFRDGNTFTRFPHSSDGQFDR